MANGKSFAGWISGKLLEVAQRRVDRDYNGNVSDYVRVLVAEDCEMPDDPARIFDGQSGYLNRLIAISEATGLDPFMLMRAVMGALVQHVEQNGNALRLPIRFASADDEATRGAKVFPHLSAEVRQLLIDHAEKGDTWLDVVKAAGGNMTEGEMHDLRLAYASLFLPRPNTLAIAAEDVDPMKVSKIELTPPSDYPTRKAPRAKKGKSGPTPPLPEAGAGAA